MLTWLAYAELVAMKQQDQILQLIKEKGILRYRDIESLQIHPQSLKRLVESGAISRIGRGLYTLPDIHKQPDFQSYAEVAKRIPHGVICLLSALAYHEITTQVPHQIWIAIEEKGWESRMDNVKIRFVRFSGTLLKEGIDTKLIQTVPVKITNPARTVADCFKYRNKIGLDVAIEALKEGWKDGRFTMDELWKYAELCRVAKVMRPYVEAIA